MQSFSPSSRCQTPQSAKKYRFRLKKRGKDEEEKEAVKEGESRVGKGREEKGRVGKEKEKRKEHTTISI